MEETIKSDVNFYTAEEVAAITGASMASVAVWRRDRKIDCFKTRIDNKNILGFDPDSLIKFLTRKGNKRYLDCALVKSNLLHAGDYAKLIASIQGSRTDETIIKVNDPITAPKKIEVVPHMPSKTEIAAFESIITEIAAFESIIRDLDKAIEKVNGSIAHLDNLSAKYSIAKNNSTDKAEINKITSAIAGINTTRTLLTNIKHGYQANRHNLRCIIDNDSRLK